MEDKKVSLIQRMILLLLLVLTILFIILYFYYSNKDTKFYKELEEIGYKPDDDTNYFEKVETNNTIEEYNKDVKEEKDSKFIKYYVTKDLKTFVELRMNYQEGVSTTLNINSNLKTSKIDYNYELSYKDTYLIFEGNTDNNYECHYVVQENIDQEQMDKYCKYVKEEITNFISKRDEFTNKKSVKERIN